MERTDLFNYIEYEKSTFSFDFHSGFDIHPHFTQLRKALSDIFPTDSGVFEGNLNSPPHIPRLAFRSSNSNLLISNLNAVFEVRYFGNYKRNYNLCQQYLEKKLVLTSQALIDCGLAGFHNLACISEMSASFGGLEGKPVGFVMDNFFKLPNKVSCTEDIEFRIGMRDSDRYFINYSIGNYKAYQIENLERLVGKVAPVPIHQATVIDEGLRIVLDVNNKLLHSFQKDVSLNTEDVRLLLGKAGAEVRGPLPDFLRGT